MKLLAVAAGVSAGLLCAEVCLRLAGFRYPNLYREDPHVGYTLRPGAEGWWEREGKTYVRINSDGLRDYEHARRKPPGTLRVAVLGDSYAEALQVPMESAFWSVAAREMQSCGAAGGRNVVSKITSAAAPRNHVQVHISSSVDVWPREDAPGRWRTALSSARRRLADVLS